MNTIMAVIGWIFFGLIAGSLGRLLVPGRQAIGLGSTIALGIAGSFAGGFVHYLIRGGDPLQPSGMLMSIAGAVVVLLIALSMGSRQRI